MTDLLTPHPTPRRAAAVLRRLFGGITTGFAFRLWDGTEVRLGGSDPVCTVVVRSPGTFGRLMRDPSPLNFAEAYVTDALDIEGDLFGAMRVANELEEIRLAPAVRLRVLASMWVR